MNKCPFCEKLADCPSGVVAFRPLNPVVPGHTLIVPTRHVEDFADDPDVTAKVMRFAAEYVASDEWGDSAHVNLITSRGVDATQSVFHFHVHLVPRWPDDGLKLPWSK